MLNGAALPEDAKTDVIIDDVSGGWATSVPAHKLSKEFSPNLRNMDIENGSIKQIKGFIEIGSTNTLTAGHEIYPYNLEDGSQFFLVTDSSRVLETSDFKSYVFVSSGHNTGVLMRCLQVEEKMWCSNGVDSVFTWDHTSKSILDGTKGTPNVSKGKYIGYYQDRVWMFNVPSDASVAYFSDSRSTNGVLIAPDNFLAWPADNFRFVGRGDGQKGTTVWNENGRLKFGKERSIYTLFGDNSSNYIPILTNASVGVASHDSVVMLDGQSHFVGNDGIYQGKVRISGLIQDEVDSIVKTDVRTVSNLWESQLDFSKGQFQGTTATVAGILQPRTNYRFITSPNVTTFTNFPIPGGQPLTTSTTFYGPIRLNFGVELSSSDIFYIEKIKDMVLTKTGSPCSPDTLPQVNVTMTNLYTGVSISSSVAVNQSAGVQGDIPFSNPNQLFEGWQVYAASMTIHFGYLNYATCGENVVVGFPGSNEKIYLIPSTTGQFISDIATNTSITTWGNIDSLYNTNGSIITHYVRSSTSVVNMTTQTWSLITPGVRLNFPTQNSFVQWASTIQSISSFTNLSNIDNVEIVHVEGEGAINRPIAARWEGNYWLFASTSADTISSYGLKKSLITNKNPDAWMPISGINIRSIVNASDSFLYAGSSSSGTFYRLDFGDNFNGTAISSVYETPDTWFDSLYKEKILNEYYLTAEKRAGSSFNLGLSIDGGSFTDTSVSLNGSGILNRPIFNVSGKGKYFRWRFSHSAYDEPFEIHNFAVTYKPTGVRKGIND